MWTSVANNNNESKSILHNKWVKGEDGNSVEWEIAKGDLSDKKDEWRVKNLKWVFITEQ